MAASFHNRVSGTAHPPRARRGRLLPDARRHKLQQLLGRSDPPEKNYYGLLFNFQSQARVEAGDASLAITDLADLVLEARVAERVAREAQELERCHGVRVITRPLPPPRPGATAAEVARRSEPHRPHGWQHHPRYRYEETWRQLRTWYGLGQEGGSAAEEEEEEDDEDPETRDPSLWPPLFRLLQIQNMARRWKSRKRLQHKREEEQLAARAASAAAATIAAAEEVLRPLTVPSFLLARAARRLSTVAERPATAPSNGRWVG